MSLQHLALPLQAARRARQQLDLGVFAQIGMAGGALRALAAEHRQAGDDMVAGFDIGDVFAHRLDHCRTFMAEHRGGRVGVESFHEVQIGMAQSSEGGTEQHFAPLRLFDLYLFDREGLVSCVKDRGFHGWFPPDFFDRMEA
jgi:hypothetical protein